MQSDLSRGGNDRIDGIESQEVEASSEVSACLSVLSFYLAMWNADMKLEKQGLWYLSKKDSNDQEPIQSSTITVPGYQMEK